MKILFICTGNTCRSPLAMALFSKMLLAVGRHDIDVLSAGIAAWDGSPASAQAREVLDSSVLCQHRAQTVNEDMLAQADLVLTMTAQQKQFLIAHFPHYQAKIYTLGEYVYHDDKDIADPFGGDSATYLQTVREIEEALTLLLEKLLKVEEMRAKMRIALASDHGGFALKEEVKEYLNELGYDYRDFGCNDGRQAVDYPDFAAVAARAVAQGDCALGIFICGTGLGVAIVANKVKGIRAVCCQDCFSAQMARAHNDANVLTLGQRVVGPGLARAIVASFLHGRFEAGRHLRRVEKIKALEEEFGL